MDLSVVAIVASIAAGVSALVATAAVFTARRSTAHADRAIEEASQISRASIARIDAVQSEAGAAHLAARHATERLRSMSKERTMPDSIAAYRLFLREVVEDSKHLLGPEGAGVLKNEALDRMRVGALVGGSDEVLRALRNFAVLRTQRPGAPWPIAYAMAYARLESDLVIAIRNDLGSSEESLTADQIWGAINAHCVDPAFRLALLSPLEDVLRHAGQDPAHYDLGRFAGPAGPGDATDSGSPFSASRTAHASAPEPRRRRRRARGRTAPEVTASEAAGATETTETIETTLTQSGIAWEPLVAGRGGTHAPAPSPSSPSSAAVSHTREAQPRSRAQPSSAKPATSTASASTEETEAVSAPVLGEAPTRRHAVEPDTPVPPGTPAAPTESTESTESTAPPAVTPRQPEPPRPQSDSIPTSPPVTSPTSSPVRAAAVVARTVTMPSAPRSSTTSAASAAAAADASGYGIMPAQAQGRTSPPSPHRTEQTSAVAAAGAVPARAVGSHRTTAPARTADSDTQETTAVPAAPQTSIPRARGA